MQVLTTAPSLPTGVIFGQWPWTAVLMPIWILCAVLAICAGLWGMQVSATECH